MMIIVIPLVFIFLGFIFMFLAELIPILDRLLFPWFGFIFTCAATIFLLYRLYVSNSFKHADKKSTWKHLINYLRRDNEVVPIYGTRAYPGESFIDVEGLGLVEFLGKDCFYTWGDKKVIWGLENINFTPDPRYFNLTHLLWELGFTDSVDVYNVLNGHDLELMARVYQNMLGYDSCHGISKLVTEMKEYTGDRVVFEPVKSKKIDGVHDRIDKLLSGKSRIRFDSNGKKGE